MSKVWVVRYTATKEPIDDAMCRKDAEDLLREYEENDKAADVYTPDFYEVVEVEYEDLPWAIPLF